MDLKLSFSVNLYMSSISKFILIYKYSTLKYEFDEINEITEIYYCFQGIKEWILDILICIKFLIDKQSMATLNISVHLSTVCL